MAAFVGTHSSSSRLVALLTMLAGLGGVIVATALYLERLRRLTSEAAGQAQAAVAVRAA